MYVYAYILHNACIRMCMLHTIWIVPPAAVTAAAAEEAEMIYESQ